MYEQPPARPRKVVSVKPRTAVAVVLGVIILIAIANSCGGSRGSGGGSSASSAPPDPAYVARLKHDGYTNIKRGVSNNAFGCTNYAVGDGGNGYGELVVQCPDSGAAYTAALNIAGSVSGNLVIKTGPMSGL